MTVQSSNKDDLFNLGLIRDIDHAPSANTKLYLLLLLRVKRPIFGHACGRIIISLHHAIAVLTTGE